MSINEDTRFVLIFFLKRKIRNARDVAPSFKFAAFVLTACTFYYISTKRHGHYSIDTKRTFIIQ